MIVETRQLTKQYGDATALRDCTLGIRKGEVFGLLGPNGSGKTTLLRLLLGFLKPTRGSARILDLDCTHQSLQVKRSVSYLPGDARLFRAMRGTEVLKFFSRIRPGRREPQARELAGRLDLDLHKRVSAMSTGMRQKLALCVALSADTPLVILDEPTSNLDPSIRGTVMQLVREARDAGRTVLFSSHVLSEVEETCDRVLILRDGKTVHTQVLSELKRQHRIRAKATRRIEAPPAPLADELTIRSSGNGSVTIETPGELSRLLGWLATLDLQEVRIDPVGLRAVYDRFHPPAELPSS